VALEEPVGLEYSNGFPDRVDAEVLGVRWPDVTVSRALAALEAL